MLVATGVTAGVSPARSGATLEELVGRRLVVAMDGTAPSTGLLHRVARGEIGGVILFGWNVRSRKQVVSVVTALDAAARSSGRPPPLVLVDQEGGEIRRFRWLPPALSASELGARSLPFVRQSGRSTGTALRSLGIDVNLAPVADTPRVPGSFLVAQGRAFSDDPQRVASRATAFARGLASAGVIATAKHFPGLGGAAANTDFAAVTIRGDATAFRADLVPFRRLVSAGIPLVMLSSAVYPAYDRVPAVWSGRVHALLRDELGFEGATITDALEALARARGISLADASLRATRAGADLLLFAGSEASTGRVYTALLDAVRRRTLDRAALEESAARIDALARR